MVEGEVNTEIILRGENLGRFLDYKGVSENQRGENGAIVIATFSGAENCTETVFGKIGLDFGMVNNSRNRAVVIFSSGLRRRGRKDVRRVTINHIDGYGQQQFASGIKLTVQTNAPAQYFENNKS